MIYTTLNDIKKHGPCALGAMGIDNEIITVVGQAADRLESMDKAIRETLEDNRHLADGEDCTLIRLKRAIDQ